MLRSIEGSASKHSTPTPCQQVPFPAHASLEEALHPLIAELRNEGSLGGASRNPNGALPLKAEPPSSAAPPSLPDYSPHTELLMEVPLLLLFFFLSFSSLRKTRNGAERKKKKKATTAAGARTKRLIFSAEEIICYISPQPDNPLLLKDEVSINVCLEQM